MRQRSIYTVKAYLPNDKEIIQIIQLCDLYPSVSWKIWTDNLNHKLRVHENKQLSCSKTNILNKKVTDLFIKTHPLDIIKKCSWVFVCVDKDDIYAYLFGMDKRLRLAHYRKDHWEENLPPLANGIRHLRLAIATLNYQGFFEKESSTKHVTKGWSLSYPFSDTMKDGMIKMHGIIMEKFLKEFE